MAKLRVLITGATGQLGQTLQAIWPTQMDYVALSHAELAIEDAAQLSRIFLHYKPHLVINLAAYTKVDLAEQEVDQAYLVNDIGVGNIARACLRKNIKLMHISTDYVYGHEAPLVLTESATNPLNVYGKSKLAGDRAVSKLHKNALILRTSWLFSPYGQNFVKTIVAKLQQGVALSVVNDQIGSPTSALFLAQRIVQLIPLFWQGSVQGLYHIANAGQCSWFEFAEEIARQSIEIGLLQAPVSIQPIGSEQWAQAAPRPRFSALNCQAIDAVLGPASTWQDELRLCLQELKRMQQAS